MRIAAGLALTIFALAAAGPAQGQATDQSTGEATAQNPPPTPQETAPEAQQPGSPVGTICTDRPTKANTPCTVPFGDFQIESGLVSWSRASADGVTTDLTVAPNPTFKYGVASTLDLELSWAPWNQLRVSAAGRTTTQTSVGDIVLRSKWAALSGEDFHLSLIPFVELPTARRGVGDRAVEGGLIAPMSAGLPASFNLTLGPQLGALEDKDGTGAHLDLINLVNLSRSVGKATLFAELWNEQNFDPSGTEVQTTVDFAATYLLNDTLQSDMGANFGLTRAAPQREFYLGVSHRF